MTRPVVSLPHPFSAVVAQIHGLFTMTTEWFGFFSDMADRTPVTGTVTFAAATTAAVTFDTPELSTDYNVLLEPTENKTFWVTGKTVNGFTINASASSSAAIGWTMTRR